MLGSLKIRAIKKRAVTIRSIFILVLRARYKYNITKYCHIFYDIG